jgi:hypothetical protein
MGTWSLILGAASSLGSQWQWQEFAPQASGNPGAGSNWPGSCPGLSGSFELGFTGAAGAGFTPVGAFIWNLFPTTGGGGGGGGAPLDMYLPNVWITC